MTEAHYAADQAPPTAQGLARDRLARIVSLVLSPVTLPPILVAVLLVIFRAPIGEILRVGGGTAVFLSLIPAGAILLLVRSGRIRSIDITHRHERSMPFALAVICGVACLGFIQWQAQTAVPILLLAVGLYVLNVAILFLINLSWKISLHCAAIAGFFLFVAFASVTDWTTVHRVVPLAPLVLASATCVSLVAWARVHNGNHTVAEALGGVVFGIVAPAAEIAAADKLGLLTGL